MNESTIDYNNFKELFESSIEPYTFCMNCVLRGKAEYATKEFFNKVLFDYYIAKSRTLHKKELKFAIYLKKNLIKLNNFYSYILEN